jgi:hypothetical protein
VQYNDIAEAGKMLPFTAGCKATMAKTNASIRVIEMKKILIPQSCPDGVKK